MFNWLGMLALISLLVGLVLVISVGLYPSAQWGEQGTILLSLGVALILMALFTLAMRNSTHKNY